jgi:ribosomal protein L37AE/L43A
VTQQLQIGGTRSGIKIRRAVDVNARQARKSAPESKLCGTKKTSRHGPGLFRA